HAAHDAEDRRVGADAERERDDDRDGESLDPQEGAQREAEIRQKAHGVLESVPKPGIIDRPTRRRLRPTPRIRPRFGARRRRTPTAPAPAPRPSPWAAAR